VTVKGSTVFTYMNIDSNCGTLAHHKPVPFEYDLDMPSFWRLHIDVCVDAEGLLTRKLNCRVFHVRKP
jgi:hypothetical protein